MLIESLVVLLVITCLIAVAIAGVDLVWQRFDHARRLRMSFQDMREETKQSEGDPHMKAQRRSRAEAIATNRMLLDVPKADVVDRQPDPLRRRPEVGAHQGLGPGLRRQGRGRAGAAHPRDRRHRRRAGPQRSADRPSAPRHRRRSAARSRPSTTAPSPRRSASPTACARAGAGAGPLVTPAALRQLDGARRGPQGARPRRRSTGSSPRTAASRPKIAELAAHRVTRRADRARRCRRSGRRSGSSGPTGASAAARLRQAALAADDPRRPRRGGPEPRQAPEPRARWSSAPSAPPSTPATPAPSARRRRRSAPESGSHDPTGSVARGCGT